MKLNFCTLFNSSYLSRGLLMYRSLATVNKDFHLYIFAFDDVCADFLRSEKLPNVTVVSLQEFEDEELLKIKSGRSAGEYCWTCASSTVLYSIEKFGLNNCTYIDADMCFYADPIVLINEMGEKDVLITKHGFTPEYAASEIYGIYCVQFVTFKNSEKGMRVLRDWRNDCIDWCYGRLEDGKFGDQKYLDKWPEKYDCVHVLQTPGGGIAPWNLQQYQFERSGLGIVGKGNKKNFEVIFFHYHGLRFYKDNIVSLTGKDYRMTEDAKNLFYCPVVQQLLQIKEELLKKLPGVCTDGATEHSPLQPSNLKTELIAYLRNLRYHPKDVLGKNLKEAGKYFHYYNTNKWNCN